MVTRLILSILLSVVSVGTATALEAGTGKADITPDLGTPLAGYYQRMGHGAVSIRDPLWVRALYLDDGATRVLLVTADLCVITPDLREAVLELAPKEVPRDHIILTATHTMTGPGGMARPMVFRLFTGRYMPELIDSTAVAFGKAMRAAIDNRKRATIGFGASNASDLVRNTLVERGPVDGQLGVIRVNDSDGKPLAIVANFGARCRAVTASGPDMLTLSAGFPGYFYSELERLAEPGCMAMFVQGACGDAAYVSPNGVDGWAAMEAFGTRLAARAFETAGQITSGIAAINVAQSEAALPPTLADAYLPSTATLASLEIGGLAMTFFPGAPCAQISLDLRQRCLDRGYDGQFTVGMANEYLFFFVPPEQYGKPGPETLLSFYGPAMGNWFAMEFSRLLSRGEAEVSALSSQPPEIDGVEGIRRVILRGPAYQRGYARGAAFREAMLAEFEHRYAARCTAGELAPQEPFWAFLPEFVQQYLATANITIPWLAMQARPMLTGLPGDLYAEATGAAAAADMPFDAAWLVQCGPLLEASEGVGELFPGPFCTMAAVVGLKAGADDILIGRNLDWPEPVTPVVYDVRPDEGYRYLMLGFPEEGGGFSGMNEAGLVVCVERNPQHGMPALEGPPVELVAAHMLQRARSVWAAIEMLDQFPHLQGYHILLADPITASSGGVPPARVVQLGGTPRLRAPSDGMLLGANPEASELDEATRARYLRLGHLIAEERHVNPIELEEMLSDTEQSGDDELSAVFNANTRYSVVFVPKERRMRVAVPDGAGAQGLFAVFEFEPDTQETADENGADS